ncbi:hypothetical protein [Methylobacterium indicum]|uniref:Uncharacterized protein n=1 Tax=Methylobacterium indicum TaxID=1775910 RepID=A0ABR5GZA9_9HYPH|nr:hypothetical protein [Methylobacterium indicum]KMO15777.1 hypothetical protein QR79_23870 [Methylobacterium indicum]KMO18053.1 hypothetical protein QR78_16215 [Methylobacterium indicum]
MSPEQAIAALDRQIALHGDDAQHQRGTGAAASLRLWVREYLPQELQGGVTQGDRKVVVSPTDVAKAGLSDLRKLDKLTIAGRRTNVEYANPTRIRGVVVRWDLNVRGS